MPVLKKRVITGILGFTLTFALVACDDGSPDTTTPAESDTTSAVGS